MIKNRKISFYFKWLLSPVILVLVYRMVDVHDLSAVLTSLRPSFLCMALLLTLLVRFIMIHRWGLLLQTKGLQVPPLKLLKIMLVSNTVGILIPSSLGGDGLRGLALWKHTGNGIESFTSIAVDRFSGLFAVSGISFVSSLVLFRTLNNLTFVMITGVLFGLCVLLTTGLFFQHARIAQFLCERLKSFAHYKLLAKLHNAIQSLLKFGQDKGTLAKVFGLSVMVQFLRILMTFSLALALGVEIPFVYFSMVFPIVVMLCMLPISIGGIGVQEATFIYFLSPLGTSVEEAVALSLLSYMIVIGWLLIGLIIYAKEGIDVLPKKWTHG